MPPLQFIVRSSSFHSASALDRLLNPGHEQACTVRADLQAVNRAKAQAIAKLSLQSRDRIARGAVSFLYRLGELQPVLAACQGRCPGVVCRCSLSAHCSKSATPAVLRREKEWGPEAPTAYFG
jgi:hypothetical protein